MSSSYRPTGHLKPKEVIPDSQRRAICNLADDGIGYRQIFSLLRGVKPNDVTDQERDLFGNIARSHGCGVNNHRMLLTHLAMDRTIGRVKVLRDDACPVKPSKAVLAAFLKQPAAVRLNKSKKKTKRKKSK